MVEPPAGARNNKKRPLQLIFNNPRTSILPGSAPDPNILTVLQGHHCSALFHICLLYNSDFKQSKGGGERGE